MYSNVLAAYYDLLMESDKPMVHRVTALVRTYTKPYARVLELGCGTGTMLKALNIPYVLEGLDDSPAMILEAMGKYPQAVYHVADMAEIPPIGLFDTIFCVFDSINHLNVIAQWERCFFSVARHLEPDGVFIFDMNTQYRLHTMSQKPIYTEQLNKFTNFEMTVRQQRPTSFRITMVFTDLKTGRVHKEQILESAYSVERVRKMLEVYFDIELCFDPTRKEITDESGRLFFVCRKRGGE